MRKKRQSASWLRLTGAALSLTLLAACGGGTGGGPGTPTPPAPPPNPDLPAPAAVPGNFDTFEFRNSEGPVLHNAAAAWGAGHSGQGVTIAFLDSGIDEDSPEFSGRLSPLSRDMTGAGRGLTNTEDHGTNVAMTAAAARDNTGVVGIAYNATILALRSDQPDSCTGGGGDLDGCSFFETVLAQGVTFASHNGAKVINISLGGDGASATLRNVVAGAVANGVLVVVAAGNDSADDPGGFAQSLGQAGNGGVIVVGSIDGDGAISDFSNRAGNQQDRFITAIGGGVCCVYEDGEMVIDNNGFATLFAGTSFAAPQVSGAAALLAQAFPGLTGSQIADILFDSAFDAGDPGTDAVFGRGILDIAAAFQPIGTTSLAGSGSGSGTAIALSDDSGSGSAAMGDALSTASLAATILDRYDRAFEVDFGSGFRGAAVTPRLRRALSSQQRNLALGSSTTSLSFAVDGSNRDLGSIELAPLHFSGQDADQSRVQSARIVTQVTPDAQFAFGYRQEAGGLVAQLQGQDGPAFMLAPSAMDDDGLLRRGEFAFALRHELGEWGLTLSADKGTIFSGSGLLQAGDQIGQRTQDGVTGYGVGLDRRFGALRTALGLTWITVLGGRFHDAFGVAGADTVFMDAAMTLEVARGWNFGAQLRQGRTSARQSGSVAAGSTLTSQAWSFDLERRGVFSQDDRIGLRIAQPLRVTGGALNLNLPIAYSYTSLQTEYGIRTLSLAPTGHEIMGEIAWHGRLLSGATSVGIFYRVEPGHYEQLPDDKGAALRWSRSF